MSEKPTKNCCICGLPFVPRNSRQKTHAGECSKQLKREWLKNPANRERYREQGRERGRKWYKNPTNRKRKREYQRERRKNPVWRARKRELDRKWYKNPTNRECKREYKIKKYRQKKISQNTFKIAAELQQLKKHITQNENANIDQNTHAATVC